MDWTVGKSSFDWIYRWVGDDDFEVVYDEEDFAAIFFYSFVMVLLDASTSPSLSHFISQGFYRNEDH